MTHPQEKPDIRRPWQPKFGMAGLLMFMFVVSYMAAGGYYLTQFLRGHQGPLAFLLFTLASPMLLMVVVSLMRAIYRRIENRK